MQDIALSSFCVNELDIAKQTEVIDRINLITKHMLRIGQLYGEDGLEGASYCTGGLSGRQ